MNTRIVVVSCMGVLFVVLNKPLSETMNRTRVALGAGDPGDWYCRAMVILFGLALTCMSFLYRR